MRVSLADNGGIAFYAFDGYGWVKSGYTSVNWSGLMRPCRAIGGNAVMLRYSNSRNLYIAKTGDTEICRYKCALNYRDPDAVVYRPGALFPVYLSDDLSEASCGSDIRWVRSSAQMGCRRRPTYYDGKVYLQTKVDGCIDTDIPMQLVRLCTNDVSTITIGVDRGVMYGIGKCENLLWCRDLRAPEPFSIGVDWGSCTRCTDVRILADSSLIVMPILGDAIRVVDIRSPAVHYEVSTMPYLMSEIVPLSD